MYCIRDRGRGTPPSVRGVHFLVPARTCITCSRAVRDLLDNNTILLFLAWNVGAGQGIIIQCLLDPGKARIQHYPSLLLINQDTKMNLLKLGFRRQPKRTLTELFRPTSPATKPQLPIGPDTDYPQHDERTPQAPAYTQMWLDHWSHWGDTKNPVGEPLQSSA